MSWLANDFLLFPSQSYKLSYINYHFTSPFVRENNKILKLYCTSLVPQPGWTVCWECLDLKISPSSLDNGQSGAEPMRDLGRIVPSVKRIAIIDFFGGNFETLPEDYDLTHAEMRMKVLYYIPTNHKKTSLSKEMYLIS